MSRSHDAAHTPSASGSPTLVASKLARPHVTNASIKPELLEKVADAGSRRLLLVCAPAGYGKSTLIAKAVERLRWNTVWYKLDALDHDPVVLVASLTEAIRRQVPGFGDVVNERLADSRDIPITTHQLLALFVHELEDEVKLTLHLVLDDYHEASASAELNEALDFLLANLPAHVHVVLLSRFEPAFSVAKLRLDDQLAELRYQDLRLDGRQIQSLFKARTHVDIPQETADRLEELTEGWPVSVVLASRALEWSGLPAIELALSDPRLRNDVFSYLAEQVFRREDDQTRTFLKHTSCLEYMTADLADEITGGDSAGRILDYLERNQVFTFADARRTSYRYHHLFRDYLRHKCAQEDGAREFHDLQLKTARVMERAGDSGVAIEIYLSANEPALALHCLASAGELALESCTLDSMSSWLRRLPSDLRTVDAWALLLEGQIELRLGRFDESVRRFREAESLFERSRDKWGCYQSASAIETALFWKGDTVASAEECRCAIAQAPDDTRRAHSLISLGAALMDESRWEECESLWSEAESLLSQSNPSETARLLCLRSLSMSLQGYVRLASQSAEEALQTVREVGPKSLEASFLNAHATIDMHLGRYAEASTELEESLTVSARYGFHHFEHITKDSLGQVVVALGDFETGYGLLEESAAAPQVAGDYALLALTHCHMGTAWRRRGELAKALDRYQLASTLARESAPFPYLTCLSNLRFTEGLASDDDSTSRDLRSLAALAAGKGLVYVALKCNFYAAALRYFAGSGDGALFDLTSTIQRQAELGHLHFLSQELSVHEGLCEDLLEHSDGGLAPLLGELLSLHPGGLPVLIRLVSLRESLAAPVLEAAAPRLEEQARARLVAVARRHPAARVRRLAHSMASDAAPTLGARPGLEVLTPREVQILGMMADGLRNDEIASALFLAPSTVKTHVNHIFSKLGVSDRVQAVLRYRD